MKHYSSFFFCSPFDMWKIFEVHLFTCHVLIVLLSCLSTLHHFYTHDKVCASYSFSSFVFLFISLLYLGSSWILLLYTSRYHRFGKIFNESNLDHVVYIYFSLATFYFYSLKFLVHQLISRNHFIYFVWLFFFDL